MPIFSLGAVSFPMNTEFEFELIFPSSGLRGSVDLKAIFQNKMPISTNISV